MRTTEELPARKSAHSAAGALLAAGVAVAGTTALRNWQRRWAASPDEIEAQLPGDEQIAEPVSQQTRAITIQAPVADVWPWIVQLGADRAGFYSYDWLENIFGLGIHSADVIVPAWQALSVGDLVRANRTGDGGWYVVELRPEHTLAMKVADVKQARPIRRDEGLRWEFLWTFAVLPVDDGNTRLLVRERVAFGRALTRWLMSPVGLVSFVMTRRMLIGIRQRAELLAHGSSAHHDR